MNSLSDGQLYHDAAGALAHVMALVKEMAERQGCGPHFAPQQHNIYDTFSSVSPDDSETCCEQVRVKERLGQVRHAISNDSDVIGTFACRREWESHDTQLAQSALMKVARLKQGSDKKVSLQSHLSFQNGRGTGTWIIHPQSFQRVVWDVLSVVIITHGFVVLPLAAFDLPNDSLSQVSEWVNAIFWAADIIMSFRTGFCSGDNVEMDARRVALKYSKTWLVPDLSLVIVEWSSQAHDGTSYSSARLTRVFKMIRFVRMFRYMKLVQAFRKIELLLRSRFFLLSLSVFKLSLLLLLAVHFICCGWFAVGRQPGGWVGDSKTDADGHFLSQYLTSARWTLAQINGQTDQVRERTTFEKLYTCICAMFTILIMSVFVSSITARMLDLQSIGDERSRYMRELCGFLEQHKISWQCGYRARVHVQRLYRIKTMRLHEPSVLGLLPNQLQAELLFEARSPHLQKHPLFHYVAGMSHCMRSLCSSAVKPLSASAADTIFEKDGKCDHMTFVEHGELVYSTCTDLHMHILRLMGPGLNQESLKAFFTDHLHGEEVVKGMWLSEAALWVRCTHRGGLITTSESQMLQVGAGEFANVGKQFPEVSSFCALYAHAFCAAFFAERSDLMISTPPPDVERFCLEFMKAQPMVPAQRQHLTDSSSTKLRL